jgi:type IV pilus assembly protein PilW
MSLQNLSQTEPTPLLNWHARQRGFSLIELMVALALGLIIVAAMSQLFVGISRSNLEMAKTNSQIESARFAMQFMQDDIIHGGYWGGFIPDFDDLTFAVDEVPLDAPIKPADHTLSADVCRSFDVATWDDEYREYLLGIPVEVYGPSGTPLNCDGVIDDRLAGTDLLIVRHASTCVAGVDVGCEAFDANKLYLRASNCFGELPRYQLDPAATPLLTKLDCSEDADPRKFVQNIYYIRDWAYEDAASINGKDGIPTLVRSEFDNLEQQAPVALVEGIERFRVELGIDRVSQTGDDVDYTKVIGWLDEDVKTTPCNRGDGIPEGAFERCLSEDAGCEAKELSNVVAVKLYIMARANEFTQGYTDSKSYALGSAAAETIPFPDNQFKRHVFSSTVRLNNVGGRRETPFDLSEVGTCP